MTDDTGLMTSKELSTFLGPFWRRVLNPFRSDLSRVEAATRGNPLLNRRARYCLRKSMSEEDGTRFAVLSMIVGNLMFLALMSFIQSRIIYSIFEFYMPLSLLASLLLCFLSLKRITNTQRDVPECLLAKSKGTSTGNPTLDDLTSRDPFEVEYTLMRQGMDASEISRVADLIDLMAENRQGARTADNLLHIQTSWTMSPEAEALVNRVSHIMGNTPKGTPLLTADPIATLGHIGIDLDDRHAVKG